MTPPTHVLVPVGALEQAAKLADDAADEMTGTREHDHAYVLARCLYAAARGVEVDWAITLAPPIPDEDRGAPDDEMARAYSRYQARKRAAQDLRATVREYIAQNEASGLLATAGAPLIAYLDHEIEHIDAVWN